MSTTRHFVEGETQPLTVTLYDGDGATRVAIDGTSLVVTLVVRDRTGATVPMTGKVDWEVVAAGSATYEPEATDLRAANSPYAARWIVTDGQGDWAAYPNGEAERWVVRK